MFMREYRRVVLIALKQNPKTSPLITLMTLIYTDQNKFGGVLV